MVGCICLSRIGSRGIGLSASSVGLAREAAGRLKLNKLPNIVCSARVSGPMSWGIVRPQVLLPETFDAWALECRKAVLLHELSHVARRDSIFDLLARVCLAIYWFHPAVYFATRSLARAREEATDEHVLMRGLETETYARNLLEVAERCLLISHRDRLPAISMASHSPIESRLRMILAYQGDRSLAWPVWRWIVLATSFQMLLVLAMPLRLIAVTGAAVQEGVQDVEQKVAPETANSEETKGSLFERFQALTV